MSPRIKKIRKVFSPPPVKGFRPYGGDVSAAGSSSVSILYEEYEALRLCDYDMYNHHQASVLMGVSRPTFTRIYSSATEKISEAYVEGKQISIEGGKVYFDSDWYFCRSCESHFNNPDMETTITNRPLCKSPSIEIYEPETVNEDPGTGLSDDSCICPSCGYEVNHRPGRPCSHEICPQCNVQMRRKGAPYYRNRHHGGR
jgi:predicted DNA-binding protein (UPF0251 family)